ncbi:MAG: serine/threonine-protein kinase [Pirellulaceae bacterium]
MACPRELGCRIERIKDGDVADNQRSLKPGPLPRVEIDGRSGLRMTTVTERLLQRRLRSAAFLLGLGFGLFLIRRLFVGSPFWWFHVAVVLLLFATVGLLVRCQTLSLRKLRLIEFYVFGVPVVELAFHQYAHILRHAQCGESTLAFAALKSTTVYFFAMIVVYGMFIPNCWRRAAVAVLPMAIVPLGLTVLLIHMHPEVAEVVFDIGLFVQQSDDFLMLLLGVICAVFGTHIVNSLRTEAFHAQELGRYRLKKKVGSGGMGEVFLAEHQLLKRPCAIKLIRPDKAGDPETLARFEREVRATANLSHPNTIEVYDYGITEDGTFFYVMEYLPGMDLAELVERFGPLSPRRVIHLLWQVCGALAEAHGVGLIHRDIKPSNIFCTCRGGMYDVAKLLDFGLVWPTTGVGDVCRTQPAWFAGSPLYMSPQQVMNHRAPDACDDVYSLGAVAYFLLTGHPPFERATLAEVLVAHARDQVLPPSKLRAGVPQDLQEVIIRCLAKNPQERYCSALALAAALSQCEAANRWTSSLAAHWWQASDWEESGEPSHDQPTLEVTMM